MSKAAPQKKPGRSLEDFRAAHDKSYIVPRLLTEALEKLGASWVYELEIIKLAGISTTDLAAYRDQFEDHIVLASRSRTSSSSAKRIWCGTKEFAAELRAMV